MEFINVEYDSEHNYNSCAKYKKKVFKYKYNLQKKKKVCSVTVNFCFEK